MNKQKLRDVLTAAIAITLILFAILGLRGGIL
jgi:hypothetical protein